MLPPDDVRCRHSRLSPGRGRECLRVGLERGETVGPEINVVDGRAVPGGVTACSAEMSARIADCPGGRYTRPGRLEGRDEVWLAGESDDVGIGGDVDPK